MQLNEEMVKNGVILPMLIDLGFNEDELEFEHNFSIQLGRGVYNVRNEMVKIANGRLDILCKLDGKNLFVIELKAEGIEFDEQDRRQGLSYARLLEPMAPYVLVTNGSKSIIYSTITGKDIKNRQKEYLLNEYNVSIDEEVNLRFEALKQFIGYSYDNLLKFCSVNNEDMLSKFCTQSNKLLSEQMIYKYIPSVYINRNELENMFRTFISQNDKCVFAIIGDSGVGKTNLMCHLVQLYSSEPCLFYSGSILSKSFFNELVMDFNLIFSSEESDISVLKKISALFRMHNKQLIIFLDAIDEWVADDKVQQINRLVKCLKKLNIKLCVSCKSSIWNAFINSNGIRTEMSDCLYPGIPILTNFNETEVEQAISRYSSFFKIDQTTNKNQSILYNPFALRIAFEVAYSDRVPLNYSLNSRRTFTRYISLKLEKCNNSNLVYRFLDGIAKHLFVLGKVQTFEEELRTYLNMGINDEIPEELFSLNFLYKYFDENSKVSIGFYFSGIRDYIVAIRIASLDVLNTERRREKISELLPNFIGENAVEFFFKTGNANEQDDCISSYIEYDTIHDKFQLTKLISLNGSYFNLEVDRTVYSKIIEYLKIKFEQNKASRIVAEQVVLSMSALSKFVDVEQDLIDLFEIILYKNCPSYVSHMLAELLKQYNSTEGTDRLIQLLLEVKNSGYVRRYLVESISMRSTFDRKDIFLKLIVDESPDVRTWVKGWYTMMEDTLLRDKLLEIADTINADYICEYIFKMLSYSKIEDTGEKLFDRLKNKKYSYETTGWLCRSLADLEYKAAIPTLIQLFVNSKDERFSELILLSISSLGASEAATVILDKIYNSQGTGSFITWLCESFAEIALDEHIQNLIERNIKSNDENLDYYTALVLSYRNCRRYSEIIFKFIMNKSLDINKRCRVLHNWIRRELYNNTNHILTDKSDEEIAITYETIKDNEMEYLYQLAEENSEISIISIGALMSLEENIDKLYYKIIEYLPKLDQHFSRRVTSLIYSVNLRKFCERIRPWLTKQIYLDCSNKIFMKNCLELCVIVGDNSTVEAICDNKIKLAKYLGERYIDEILHSIRSGNRFWGF